MVAVGGGVGGRAEREGVAGYVGEEGGVLGGLGCGGIRSTWLLRGHAIVPIAS